MQCWNFVILLLSLSHTTTITKAIETAATHTSFASCSDGDTVYITPGTMSTTDGLQTATIIQLSNKYFTLICVDQPSSPCNFRGSSGKRVMYIRDNGGVTTLKRIVIREGSNAGQGGGIWMRGSSVDLIIVSIVENDGTQGGGIYHFGGSGIDLNIIGCFFENNAASRSDYGNDVYKDQNLGDVNVEGCPVGYRTQTSAGAPLLGLKPDAQFPDGHSSYTCIYCPGGTSSNAGASTCSITCEAGEYSPGGTACLNCPDGKYSLSEASFCTGCVAGEGAGNGNEDESCENCVAGRYSPANASPCLECGEGKWSDTVGSDNSDTCSSCVAGR